MCLVRSSSRKVVAVVAGGLLALLVALVMGAACDSNPTPHPGNKGDDATIVDAAEGGRGEETNAGFDNEGDPADYADSLSPTGAVDAGDAGDAANADDNETSALSDAVEVGPQEPDSQP